MALTAFLTGVTEPVEFTFMFLAPILYVIHAILTGISMALMTSSASGSDSHSRPGPSTTSSATSLEPKVGC